MTLQPFKFDHFLGFGAFNGWEVCVCVCVCLSSFQRQAKVQQLQGKIVSTLFCHTFGHFSRHVLRIRPPCTGVKTPKLRKEGFGVEKPSSPHPRKGRFESENPHFPCDGLDPCTLRTDLQDMFALFRVFQTFSSWALS